MAELEPETLWRSFGNGFAALIQRGADSLWRIVECRCELYALRGSLRLPYFWREFAENLGWADTPFTSPEKADAFLAPKLAIANLVSPPDVALRFVNGALIQL